MIIPERFMQVFNRVPDVHNFTPGRVNLIGEHTDYNGGMVLPTALPLGISIALSSRRDDVIRIWSDKFEDLSKRSLSDTARDHWSDYVTGAVILANGEGLLKGGADVAVQTTLPFGAGISSSAAVTVGVLKLAQELAKSDLSDTDISILVLRPLPYKLQRRARHCMSEHRRTIDSVKHIRGGDLEAFGALMIQSHISMRDDFEITLPKVDRLVEDAIKFGALGARQTGGGFGGCIVACVEKIKLDIWRKQLLATHTDAFLVV